MQDHDKLRYLAKTLSRTKRKDYENYVVNAVWNRVGNKDLLPVSQQYIARPGAQGGYYLIDLYFPQLNIGIECDEAHHKRNEGADKAREAEIIDVLRQVRSESPYRALHVDTSKSYQEVERQIDECVAAIKQQAAQCTLEPTSALTPAEYFGGKDVIRVADDCSFATIAEACNVVFAAGYNEEAKGPKKSYFTPHTLRAQRGGGYKVWFPKLAVAGSAVTRGHNNQLSLDGLSIEEYNEGTKDKPTVDAITQRVVFPQYKDPITGQRRYRFAGVFVGHKTRGRTVLYKRVSDCFEIVRAQ